MRRLLLSLSSLVVAVVVTGCAGYGPGSQAKVSAFEIAQNAAHVTPNTLRSGGRVYVTDSRDNSENVYAAAGHDQSPLLTLPGHRPTAVAADERGNVYVSSTDDHAITEFPPGKTTVKRTLLDTLAYPMSLTVGSDGTVYAANFFDFNFNPVRGDVVEYARGATSPTTLLKDPKYGRVRAVALDANENLYVGYINPGVDAGIDVYPPHGTVGHDLGLNISSMECLAIDASGGILISQSAAGTVQVFARGSKVPTRTISGLSMPTGLAFNDNKTHLYVAETQFRDQGSVRELDYATGETLDVISKPNSNGFCGVAATL